MEAKALWEIPHLSLIMWLAFVLKALALLLQGNLENFIIASYFQNAFQSGWENQTTKQNSWCLFGKLHF